MENEFDANKIIFDANKMIFDANKIGAFYGKFVHYLC